jgi:hypothetical protein
MVSLFFPRCANIVPPTGGPRDTIPPVLVRSNPPNYSTRFTGREIHIEFDEFIQLRNVNQQFIITPPQTERPIFRVRGRNLYIDINADPIPNATYTLNFGEAIVDLNEGNALSNFEFVFSTGDVIDSLSYSGYVLNAYDNKPVEGVVVMMYDVLQDSVPYRKIPLYANRTRKDGGFQLNNLRADTFLIFALTDANNNYLYDRPGEEAIAFLNEYKKPIWKEEPESHSHIDTLNGDPAVTNDSLVINGLHDHNNDVEAPVDTIPSKYDNDSPVINGLHDHDNEVESAGDTIPSKNGRFIPVFNYVQGDTLYLFTEKTGRQFISRNERRERSELLFVFNRPLEGEWSIEPVNFTPPENWKIIEKNPANDSIRFWITDRETQEINQLRFLVTYMATGPSDSLRQVSDSLNMNYTPPVSPRRQAQADETPVLGHNFGITARGNQDLNKNLRISFPVPLSSVDLSKTKLTTTSNNSVVQRRFQLVRDSVRIRNYNIVTSWVPGHEYRFVAEPGAFTGINGLRSDSIDFTFTTREEDYYGRIFLDLTGVESHIILQLLDERDNVLREYFTDRDMELNIDYLPAQRYRLKVIFDDNNNKKWDTGNYLKGIQPERVTIYRDEVTTRPNWDIEVSWDLNMAAFGY